LRQESVHCVADRVAGGGPGQFGEQLLDLRAGRVAVVGDPVVAGEDQAGQVGAGGQQLLGEQIGP
jgi:hypothetical protein